MAQHIATTIYITLQFCLQPSQSFHHVENATDRQDHTQGMHASHMSQQQLKFKAHQLHVECCSNLLQQCYCPFRHAISDDANPGHASSFPHRRSKQSLHYVERL
jgi:hypothetical protein